jgi:hypothetical protein
METGGSEIIIYQAGDGKTRIDVRMEGEKVRDRERIKTNLQ